MGLVAGKTGWRIFWTSSAAWKSALDPEKLRERIENIDEMGRFIPTPAKIVPFPLKRTCLHRRATCILPGRSRMSATQY